MKHRQVAPPSTDVTLTGAATGGHEMSTDKLPSRLATGICCHWLPICRQILQDVTLGYNYLKIPSILIRELRIAVILIYNEQHALRLIVVGQDEKLDENDYNNVNSKRMY